MTNKKIKSSFLNFENIFIRKENISLSILISSIYCLFIISNQTSLQGVRFTNSHDPIILYKTAYDLINSLSGGNSGWSIFDLANRTFISFGAITHSLFSFPIAIIYLLIHKIIPNIPENILYRNVFIFSFFPLVNVLMTLGYNLWLKSLKINNYLVSTLLIPLLMMLFGNEIWGLLYTSPSISLLPFLLLSSTLILKKKFKVGLFLLCLFSLISFIQLPLLFIAYILPFPWMFLVIYGLINFFGTTNEELNFKKYNYTKALLISFLISIITAIPKIAVTLPFVIERIINKLNYGHNLFNSDYIYEFINLISTPYRIDNSNLLGILSIFSFGFSMVLINYMALMGVANCRFKRNKIPIILKDFIAIFNKIKLKQKYLLILTGISSVILLVEIVFIIKDLRENYYADSSRLSSMFNLTEFHKRNFAKVFPVEKLIPDLFNYKKNLMLEGRFGYVGFIPLFLFFVGLKNILKNNSKILTSLFILIILIFFLNISHPFLATIIFVFSSLLYPFSFLQNNLSMLNYQLDYLMIPFIAIGFSSTLFFIKNIIDNSFLKNIKFLDFIKTAIIIIPFYLFSFFELLKVKNYIGAGNATYESLKVDKGIINGKNQYFLIDIQNPLLKTSPVFNYFGFLPQVYKEDNQLSKNLKLPKDYDNWSNNEIDVLKSYGTKFEHISDYYKVLFVSRYSNKSKLYETRHSSIEIDDPSVWPENFITILNKNPNSERKYIKKEFEFNELPIDFLNCQESKKIECSYINNLIINISYQDLIQNSILVSDKLIGLKLPEYISHIHSNIFYGDKEVELKYKIGNNIIKLKPVQGYLDNGKSFDIGNIKSNYLVLQKSLINDLNSSNSKLSLIIKSPIGTSIIRSVDHNNFTYFINTNKNDKVIISTPFSKNFSIKQNNKLISFKKSNRIKPGLVEFNSNVDGISKIQFNYKKHKLSNISFPLINSLLTLISFGTIFFIVKNLSLI